MHGRGGDGERLKLTLHLGLHNHINLMKTSTWDHLSTTVKGFYHGQSNSLLLDPKYYD